MFSNSKSDFLDTFSASEWATTNGWPDAWCSKDCGDLSSFFYADQFAAGAALGCLAEMVTAQGVPIKTMQLAHRLGTDLNGRVHVKDLINAAKGLGLMAHLERHPPAALADLHLPVLVFLADGSHGMQLVTQCDGKYVLMHNHASLVPKHSMVPLVKLASAWALGGQGWVLRLQR